MLRTLVVYRRLGLPALTKQNPKIVQSLAIDYSDTPAADIKPILTFKTGAFHSSSMSCFASTHRDPLLVLSMRSGRPDCRHGSLTQTLQLHHD